LANRHTRVTEFERDVRAAVYHGFREKGWSPSVAELAAMLGASDAEVGAALRRLGEEHALVLQPDGESVRMAHPFSAVPTDTLVTIGGRQWFGNCVWDGLAIVSLFGGTGRLDMHSPATGASIVFDVTNGVVNGDGVAHFLVPAARFWDDIAFT